MSEPTLSFAADIKPLFREGDRAAMKFAFDLWAYDETGSTDKAIELGLARTGKLVTSAALVLMFAFLVLSTSPGYEIKPLAIGLAAGIIFDATVIRALLVPALMKLMGDANWWMPRWMETALRMPHAEPAVQAAEAAPEPAAG